MIKKDCKNSIKQVLNENSVDHKFCIAPMMDWSDRHCRYFWRLLSQKAFLYTEMITTGALNYGDVDYHLAYDDFEHPIAVQLGGSDPIELSKAATLCEKYGYDEINLNVGCPSERVKSGAFGACLMNEPNLVANCINAMRSVTSLPITIKCRIGIDDNDSYESLCHFIQTNKEAGCHVFIVHARKAWLSGLSPKQNREVPPLNYPRVFQLKQDFPELSIILNGGLKSVADCQQALQQLDGVMIGREAYQNPFHLNTVDTKLFNDQSKKLNSRLDIAHQYANYIEKELSKGTRLHHMTRHILGLFNGVPGARQWRRQLSENTHKHNADLDVYFSALEILKKHSDSRFIL